MKKDLKTVANYAKLMNVTTSRIYQLIASEDIVPVIMDTFTMIDLNKYPKLPKQRNNNLNS